MNEIKVNMVKFLMTMFDSSSDSADSIKIFKANVDELVRRNQIPNNVRNLIYNMYGIANTDTFKPNSQANKLMQINMLMMQVESNINHGNKSAIENLKKNIENGVKQGTILKSARDVVFEIYDLGDVKQFNSSSFASSIPNPSPVVGKINTTRPSNSNSNDIKKKSKEVQKDIALFKSQYVPEIYYEYPNPNYDGCSGSSLTAHKKLIDATERPLKATFVIYKLISDDGCHQTHRYVDVPKEYYKPTTSIKTPTTGSAVGCSGGYSMRNC